MPTPDGSIDLLSEPVVLDDLGPARRDRAHSGAWLSAALLLPGAAVLVGVVFWPVLRIVHASVTDPDDGFVGLRHFRATLQAEGAWSVFGRTLLWALVVPAVVTALGFGLAYLSRASPLGRRARLGPRGADRVAAGGHGYRVPVRVRPRPGARARHGHRRHRRRLARARPRHGAGVAGPGAHHLLPDVGVRLGLGRPRHDRLPHRLGPDTARAGGRGTSARWHGP